MDTAPAPPARFLMRLTSVRSILMLLCATGAAFAQDPSTPPDLATTPATAIASGAGKLYVGSLGGDLNVYDASTGKGLESIHGQAGPVSLVSSSAAGVCLSHHLVFAEVLESAAVVPAAQFLIIFEHRSTLGERIWFREKIDTVRVG